MAMAESMDSEDYMDMGSEDNFQPMSLDTSRGGGRGRGGARAKGGRRPTALPAAPTVALRSYFPETWLFDLVLSDQQGKFKRFLSECLFFCPLIFVFHCSQD
jgi:hypothetical protein